MHPVGVHRKHTQAGHILLILADPEYPDNLFLSTFIKICYYFCF